MGRDGAGSVAIREATTDEHVAVSRVLDGALLDVEELPARLDGGTVLVAVDDRSSGRSSGTIVGAIVVAPEGPSKRDHPTGWPTAAHVRAIAVRRKRRRSGIGTRLLDAAVERWSPLVADFEPEVAQFYEAAGAESSETVDGRGWALLRDR